MGNFSQPYIRLKNTVRHICLKYVKSLPLTNFGESNLLPLQKAIIGVVIYSIIST